ncbi:positive regulation of extent of heterochromatin assembly, partial [Spiromyces aspiralis]
QEDRDSEVDVVGESEAEEEYDVKRIIGKRVSSSEGVQYFIEWSGYPLSDSTWEEVENLRCPAAVIEFEVQLQQERKNNQPTEWFEDEGLVVMLQDARRLYKGVNVFNSYDEKGNLQPERKQRPGDLRKLTLRGGKPIKILDSIKDTNGRRFHLLKWQSGDKCWASVDRLPVPSRLIQNYEHKKFREERSKLIAHVLARKPSTLVRSKAGVDGGGALPVAHPEIDAVPQKAN